MKDIQKHSLRELLTKKPFTRITATGHYNHGEVYGDPTETAPTTDFVKRKIVTQEDFLRELDPYGHLINDREYYPDVWRQNTQDGLWYLEEVPRYAFSFQAIIMNKQLTHLTGNDIQFELADKKDDEDARSVYNAFKRGWNERNMETAWYQIAKSVKATGDGAFVGFLDKGKFGWKVLSFLNGDKLYPHYDLKTGKLKVFARTYSNYDEQGKIINKFIDVWDDKYYYRYKASGQADTPISKFKNSIMKMFSVSGYELDQEPIPHGFEDIPVSYQRDEMGACWTYSQETIDNYEMAFSRMAQSNHDFGLPIMYVKGEGSEEVTKQDMSHASKIFILPSDGDMGFINKQDASQAYKTELEVLEKQIYTQSFTVIPPELKSGDLPGVAIKLLYSPAYEKAITDANEFDAAVDKIIEIFSFGYGVETKNQIAFKNTAISHYIKPYIHLNETELTNNLAIQVQNGFLSKQTASEKSTFATPQEWDRILLEKKHDQEMDLILEEQRVEIQNEPIQEDNNDDENEPKNIINTETGVNNGHGRGKYLWDKNGNKIDPKTGKPFSKWDKWNSTH